MGPLKGVKILDMSRVLAGPWAGQLLADLGADVIKIERPGVGDDTRGWGPPYLKDRDGNETPEAGYYLSANRGKRSIAVDITTKDGQGLIRELADKSDVLLENYKVGGLDKYGLDYGSLKESHPHLVYCSITGFGHSGPLATRAGYDFMIQAMSGLMSVTGIPDGEAGAGPAKVGVAISDLATGLYGVIGILAALRHRDLTGQGQHIDMSLLDTTLGLLANQNTNYLFGDKSPERAGNAHLNIVPYQDFETSDGHIIVAAGNDRQFAAFVRVAGHPELADDPRYRRNRDRVEHRESLLPRIKAFMREKSTAEWVALLEADSVPCGPINTIADAFAMEQTEARGMLRHIPHPHMDALPSVACPIQYSETPLEYNRPPPLLAEHTDEILSELGRDAGEISALRQSGVVA